MNILCLGGRTLGPALAWDLVETFLAAEFSQAPRHLRRLRKVAALEDEKQRTHDMIKTSDPETTRKADHAIEPVFIRRWSPRAMRGQPLTEEELLTLFEAARWAPSTFNEQEWRFLYARRDTPQWPLFFDLLM
jgi:Nitroreductase family/Ribose/Galactose Isomerase